jgi:hypothetical protein
VDLLANVPIGLALIPLAARMPTESHGPDRELGCAAWRA